MGTPWRGRRVSQRREGGRRRAAELSFPMVVAEIASHLARLGCICPGIQALKLISS